MPLEILNTVNSCAFGPLVISTDRAIGVEITRQIASHKCKLRSHISCSSRQLDLGLEDIPSNSNHGVIFQRRGAVQVLRKSAVHFKTKPPLQLKLRDIADVQFLTLESRLFIDDRTEPGSIICREWYDGRRVETRDSICQTSEKDE